MATRRAYRCAMLVVLLAFLSACATVGREFSATKVYDIQIGKTTQAEIQALFGAPWRVGLENGDTTWTYARYHYNAFRETDSKDLVVRFDAKDVVRSYTFNSSDPRDIKPEHAGR